MKKRLFILGILMTTISKDALLKGQTDQLTVKVKSIILLSSHAAQGNLAELNVAIHNALDAGLTINEAKETFVHLYAYAGFPRSIRGLQTLMLVLDDRKGKADLIGKQASLIKNQDSKYERGKKILEILTQTPQSQVLSGYASFAPVIDQFLKEHLFADIFERDVLSYTEREWITISVLSALGGLEPMLRSHLGICLNLGINSKQLAAFIQHIGPTIGAFKAEASRKLIQEATNEPVPSLQLPYNEGTLGMLFTTGEKLTNNNFTGTAYLQNLISADSYNATAVGSVTFEAGARTKWHYHPAGQILLVTDGMGFYQEKGKPKRILYKGDVVNCPPNTPHWHGASTGKSFVQIAITNNSKGTTVWLDPVTDEEYQAPEVKENSN